MSAGSSPIRSLRRGATMPCSAKNRRSSTARCARRAPAGGSVIRFEGVSFSYPGARRPALADIGPRNPGRDDGGPGRPFGRRQDDDRQPIVALLGSECRADPDRRGRSARFRARPSAGAASRWSRRTRICSTTPCAPMCGLARPEADEAAIRRAFEQAALADFVESLPEGLDTMVGERGVQLSGGQRQRVAIARAFLEERADPDPRRGDLASRRGQRGPGARSALAALMRDRTTIVIAHRLSTVRDADRLAVLDQRPAPSRPAPMASCSPATGSTPG